MAISLMTKYASSLISYGKLRVCYANPYNYPYNYNLSERGLCIARLCGSDRVYRLVQTVSRIRSSVWRCYIFAHVKFAMDTLAEIIDCTLCAKFLSSFVNHAIQSLSRRKR